MRTKKLIICLFSIVSFAFAGSVNTELSIAGKTWYYHSVFDDYIELRLSKANTKSNGTFSWITGKGITDKKEGTYTMKNNILTLNFYWTGIKTITKAYKVEHETKAGFLLTEKQPGVNDTPKSFLFTSSKN